MEKNTTAQPEELIVVEWHGPLTLEEAVDKNSIANLSNGRQIGLYQIYGNHPTNGADQLLYISRTVGVTDTFPGRIAYEDKKVWVYDNWQKYCPSNLAFYLGYLCYLPGMPQPSNAAWDLQICKAEATLIFANTPAWNSKGIPHESLKIKGQTNNTRVINIGNFHRLLPESSMKRFQIIAEGDHRKYR